ncbi:Asp23/Gls24 family envelope stress response protein [Streptomyces sp. NPDC014724]|uniref:Asp23/Gls24 family envelope stress response protein n=1 Tax=unclassified Streptomyces TaxID=2593676 RepID=UPI003700ED3E
MTSDADRRSGIPAGERGAIAVADRVVAKIASHVAREALGRFTESASHVPPGRQMPRATASVRLAPEQDDVGRGRVPAESRSVVLGEARMRIAVELGYPSDIGAQCAAVRREVTERLRTWAGIDVSELTVSVERLHSRHADQVRVR